MIYRRAFATITAITLVGLAGFALACLTLAFSNQARRSGDELGNAQLRQLVVAGSVQAKALLRSGQAQTGDARTVKLPEELARDGAKVELRFRNAERATVAEIDASLARRHLSEGVRVPQ